MTGPRVHDLLLHHARTSPDRPALADGDTTLGYGDLAREALAVAGDLAAAGVAPGERVGLLLPNVVEFPIAYYGALVAGAVVVPLNTRLTPHELDYIVRDAGLSLVGTVLGAESGLPIRIEYRVMADAAGLTTAVHVRQLRGFDQRAPASFSARQMRARSSA